MTDRRDLLRMLANSLDGCTKAVLMAHGFRPALINALVREGLATTETWPIRAGARTVEVTHLRITDAGAERAGGLTALRPGSRSRTQKARRRAEPRRRTTIGLVKSHVAERKDV